MYDTEQRVSREAVMWKQLARPFDVHDLEWKPSSKFERNGQLYTMAMLYVTARAIMDRLDEVVGPGNWEISHEATTIGTLPGVLTTLRLRYTDDKGTARLVTKQCGSDPSDMEGFKGALSGGIKRVAVQVGIGRYLYYLKSMPAPARQAGRSVRIDPKWVPQLPPWALPGGSGHPNRAEALSYATAHETALDEAPGDPEAAGAEDLGQRSGRHQKPARKPQPAPTPAPTPAPQEVHEEWDLEVEPDLSFAINVPSPEGLPSGVLYRAIPFGPEMAVVHMADGRKHHIKVRGVPLWAALYYKSLRRFMHLAKVDHALPIKERELWGKLSHFIDQCREAGVASGDLEPNA